MTIFWQKGWSYKRGLLYNDHDCIISMQDGEVNIMRSFWQNVTAMLSREFARAAEGLYNKMTVLMCGDIRISLL